MRLLLVGCFFTLTMLPMQEQTKRHIMLVNETDEAVEVHYKCPRQESDTEETNEICRMDAGEIWMITVRIRPQDRSPNLYYVMPARCSTRFINTSVFGSRLSKADIITIHGINRFNVKIAPE